MIPSIASPARRAAVAVTAALLPGLLLPGLLLPAAAQTGKPAKAPAGMVVVHNARAAALVELAIVSRNKKLEPVTVARNVAGGASARSRLPKNGGCVYDVDGLFEDQTTVEIAGVNLCKDGVLRLVE